MAPTDTFDPPQRYYEGQVNKDKEGFGVWAVGEYLHQGLWVENDTKYLNGAQISMEFWISSMTRTLT